MFIEEIVVDGFKSYAQRTVVPNFDPFFNAITGLNGSGKSNILDSICFVLGITNLSQVRAGSLQELVYKQGQAGVTKASVSIVFNNSDPTRSPVGYESCEQITVTRQIVIGGRNKYLINGHVAQPSRVQNLFHSVQLNVNNPHFLIMQGRITKVLNMKPAEILSMLEEAAGTRMYETKKENALKTLDKKQTKVEEINKLLEEDILPALEKLRKERGDYMRWTSANDKLERLRRFCVAFEYVRACAAKESSSGGTEELKAQMRALAAEANAIEADVAQHAAAAKRLTAEKEEQMSGDVKRLSEEVEAVSKHLVQETAVWTNKKEVLSGERDAERSLRSSVADVEATIADHDKSAKKLDAELTAARAALDALVRAAEEAERTLTGVQSGKGTGDDMSLTEKLADAKARASAAEAEVKSSQMRSAHLTKELAVARASLRDKEKAGGKAEAEMAAQLAAAEGCRKALKALNYDTASMPRAEQAVSSATAAVSAARDKVDTLSGQLASLDFQFRDPEKNFDRSRVKGKVAKLLRVKDAAATTALEVLAGGKLHQLVVDTDTTGKALLANGQLKQRVTIIPLNRVQSRTATAAQQAAATTVSKGTATLALSLVGYEDEVQAAMKYVFGAGFVCKDATTAKAVAFHRDVMMKCVTHDGDLFDPSGTLTGGSRANGASVLAKLHQLAEAEAELEARTRELNAAQATLRTVQVQHKEYAKLEADLELKEHSLALLKDRVSASEVHQLSEAVARCEAELAAATAAASDAAKKGEAAKADAVRIEKEIGAFASDRDKRLKAAEKAIKDSRAAVTASRAGAKALEDRGKAQQAERKAATDELASLQEQLAAAVAQVAATAAEAAALEAKVAKRKAAYEVCSSALEESKQRARACDRELNALATARAALEKSLADKSLEAKKLEHKVTRLERDARDADERVARLQQAHPWIAAEKALFGRAGGDYDWDQRAPDGVARELAALEAEQEKLAKSVNKKVLGMFDKAEAEYKELTEKRRIVLNDKDKIEAVIFELDEKKKEALVATWQQVNRDFGSIFSTLLPGTSAKLEPPEGGTCLDGLEVRVAFGSVWKQSLTELSGGQRSLLALSLILALLLFKPAPIYILDEVDAALDLSHTQNIGRMIRTHFPQSQFIVVSLKEGMFNNANVIFRTKFVDGVSTVMRTVPALKDMPPGANHAQQEEAKRRRVAQATALKENMEP